ncbi:MAG: hypothetical protein ACRD93_02395, partial [Nitrososphaeraceae archaeon]
MKSNKFFISKLTLLTVILLGATIIFGTLSYQSSFAPHPDDMMMMADPTLHPENVTASVGDLILVTFSSSAGMRVPEPNKPIMEVSWVGGGNYRGTTNVSDFGTVWVEFGADGISRSHGQGMIMDSKGEVATYTVQALGTMGNDGYLRNHGMVFFNASSGGVFAPLSKT